MVIFVLAFGFTKVRKLGGSAELHHSHSGRVGECRRKLVEQWRRALQPGDTPEMAWRHSGVSCGSDTGLRAAVASDAFSMPLWFHIASPYFSLLHEYV